MKREYDGVMAVLRRKEEQVWFSGEGEEGGEGGREDILCPKSNNPTLVDKYMSCDLHSLHYLSS